MLIIADSNPRISEIKLDVSVALQKSFRKTSVPRSVELICFGVQTHSYIYVYFVILFCHNNVFLLVHKYFSSALFSQVI